MSKFQLWRQFHMFLSISRLFLRWRGAKVYSQTGWGHGRIPPVDPPLTRILFEYGSHIGSTVACCQSNLLDSKQTVTIPRTSNPIRFFRQIPGHDFWVEQATMGVDRYEKVGGTKTDF